MISDCPFCGVGTWVKVNGPFGEKLVCNNCNTVFDTESEGALAKGVSVSEIIGDLDLHGAPFERLRTLADAAPLTATSITEAEKKYAGEHPAPILDTGPLRDGLEKLCADKQGPYAKLRGVLDRAYQQASGGKGKERHAEEGEPFEDQIICEVRRRVGFGYTRGQAVKKIYEAARLPKERAVAELLGAINYIAADIIVLEES